MAVGFDLKYMDRPFSESLPDQGMKCSSAQTKASFILAPVIIVDTSAGGDAMSFTWLCGEINTCKYRVFCLVNRIFGQHIDTAHARHLNGTPGGRHHRAASTATLGIQHRGPCFLQGGEILGAPGTEAPRQAPSKNHWLFKCCRNQELEVSSPYKAKLHSHFWDSGHVHQYSQCSHEIFASETLQKQCNCHQELPVVSCDLSPRTFCPSFGLRVVALAVMKLFCKETFLWKWWMIHTTLFDLRQQTCKSPTWGKPRTPDKRRVVKTFQLLSASSLRHSI